MKKTTYALTLVFSALSVVMFSACNSNSTSSGQTPVGPVDARKADASCDLSALNAYLDGAGAANSCNVTASNNAVVGVMSCTAGGLVGYVAGGVGQPDAAWRGIQLAGATHVTTFRCKNHPQHPAP